MYQAYSLPYSYDALEPYIDPKTLAIHYEKFYLKYLGELNALVRENPSLSKYSKIELINHLEEIPMQIRSNAYVLLGGVLNHELYFSNLNPKGNRTPKGKLKEAIDKKYGSFDNFKKEWISTAQNLFGSGYTFLVVDKSKNLLIINMSNEDSPYYYGFTPIMAMDSWEHAYYLEYQSNRDEYIKNFFNLIDFDVVEKNYLNAI